MMLKSIKKSASLARIDLSDEDIKRFADLTEIIKMIDQITTVDTTNITPLAHPLEITLRLRDDKITEFNERDSLLPLAKNKEAGVYLIPEVFE